MKNTASPERAEVHRQVVELHALQVEYGSIQDSYAAGDIELSELARKQKEIKPRMSELRHALGDEAWRASPKYDHWKESDRWLKENTS